MLMDERLIETIEKNRIILVLTETSIINNLIEKFSQDQIYKTVSFDVSQPGYVDNLSQSKKYCFILNGFGEDGKFENIFIRYGLDKFDAKVIITCRPSLLAQYRDFSFYFVPIKNNRLQKKYFAIYEIDTFNKENIPPRESKLFLKKETAPKKGIKKATTLQDHYLNQKLMTQDSAIMQCLADRVCESEAYKEFLFELIYASREDEGLQVAAANAITGLNYARVSFSGMNLSKINIPFAYLEGAILYNTNLSYANLSSVNFEKAVLEKANFFNSILKDIKFSEMRSFSEKDLFKCISIDTNGKLLAAGSGHQGFIHVWDILSGDKLCIINVTQDILVGSGHFVGKYIVQSVCFSPDSLLLASSGGFLGSTLQISSKKPSHLEKDSYFLNKDKKNQWKLFYVPRTVLTLHEDRELVEIEISEIPKLKDFLESLSPHKLPEELSNNEKMTVQKFITSAPMRYYNKGTIFSNVDIAVRIWSVESGKLEKRYSGHTSVVNCVCFSPDGGLLASGSDDCTIRIVRIKDDTLVCIFKEHTNAINSLCFSPDGLFLISGSSDNTLRIWDMSSYRLVDTLWSEGEVMVTTFSPQGNFFASTSESLINLWNFNNRKLLKTFKDKMFQGRNIVLGLHFSHDQKLLASSTSDGQTYVWDIMNEKLPYKLLEESSPGIGISFYRQSNRTNEYSIVLGLIAGEIKFIPFTPESRKNKFMTIKRHIAKINSVIYHAESKLLVSGGDDGVIIWDMNKRMMNKYLSGLDFDSIITVCLSQKGNLLAIIGKYTKSGKNCLLVWDIEKNTISSQYSVEYENKVVDISFNYNDQLLIVGILNLGIYIYDMRNNAHLLNPSGLLYCSNYSAFCLNSKRNILALAIESNINLYEISKLGEIKLLNILEGHIQNIKTILFNPDGTLLISGSENQDIFIWSLQDSGLLSQKLKPFAKNVDSISFNQDGSYLVAVMDNYNEIYIYDMKKQKNTLCFEGHNNVISGKITFINNTKFVTSSWDHVIRLWNITANETDIEISLDWISHAIGYKPRYVNITSASGLSHKNRQLLEQYGAINKKSESNIQMRQMLSSMNRGKTVNRKIIEENKCIIQMSSIEIGNISNLNRVIFSDNSKWIFASMLDKTKKSPKPPMGTIYNPNLRFYSLICVYDLERGAVVCKFKDVHKGVISALDFYAKKNILASGGQDGFVCLWSMENKKLLNIFEGFINNEERFRNIESICFHPGGKLLASCCSDGTLRIWDIESQLGTVLYEENIEGLRHIVFDITAKWFIVNRFNSIYVYDIQKFKKLYELKNTTYDPIICLAIHPNRDLLITGHGNINRNEKNIHLWDIGGKKIVKNFKGPTSIVKSVAFHPDGNYLAAGCYDNFIYLWHIEDERPIQIIRWEGSHVHDIYVIFHPADGYLAAVCKDNIIRRWKINTDYKSINENNAIKSTVEKPTVKYESLSSLTENIFQGMFSRTTPSDIQKTGFQLEKIKKNYQLPDTSQTSLEKALRQAAANNKVNDLTFLTGKVININGQDDKIESQKTALHWATIKKHKECVKLLMRAGASFDIPDAKKNTALDYAKDDLEIVDLLSKIYRTTGCRF